eukprot:2321228-Rhodomonas_salina.1
MPPKNAGKEPKKSKKQIKEEQEAERQRLAAIEEQERKKSCQVPESKSNRINACWMRAGLEREERERQEYAANAEA